MGLEEDLKAAQTLLKKKGYTVITPEETLKTGNNTSGGVTNIIIDSVVQRSNLGAFGPSGSPDAQGTPTVVVPEGVNDTLSLITYFAEDTVKALYPDGRADPFVEAIDSQLLPGSEGVAYIGGIREGGNKYILFMTRKRSQSEPQGSYRRKELESFIERWKGALGNAEKHSGILPVAIESRSDGITDFVFGTVAEDKNLVCGTQKGKYLTVNITYACPFVSKPRSTEAFNPDDHEEIGVCVSGNPHSNKPWWHCALLTHSALKEEKTYSVYKSGECKKKPMQIHAIMRKKDAESANTVCLLSDISNLKYLANPLTTEEALKIARAEHDL